MGKKKHPNEQASAEALAKALNLTEPVWAELCVEVALILDQSNTAYGDSTEKSAEILKILYPNGIKPEQYHDVRCMISVLDKFGRIANNRDAFGESPWRDSAGYSMLGYRHDLNNNPDRERNCDE